MSELDSVLERIDAYFDASIDRLFRFLSIKSISTDPAYAEDCRAAAVHLATNLANLDVLAEVHRASSPTSSRYVGRRCSSSNSIAAFTICGVVDA